MAAEAPVVEVQADTGPTPETVEALKAAKASFGYCTVRIKEMPDCDPELLELIELEVLELFEQHGLAVENCKVEIVDSAGRFRPGTARRSGPSGSACLVMATIIGSGLIATVAAIICAF